MRRAPAGVAAALAGASFLVGWAGAAARGPPEPPQAIFKDLFVAVQRARIFADGKTFADAIPKSAPALILARYRANRPASGAALRSFVAANFTLPPAATTPAAPARLVSIEEHIDSLWSALTRSTPRVPAYGSLLPLPYPYVVPGGRFREIYYWDSYFTMLGLLDSGRHELVQSMVGDFAHFIDTYDHVPNGARTYYLSRSQPPFFFEMVALLEPDQPAKAFARYLPQLRREYVFWMQGEAGLSAGQARRRVVAMPDGSILNRYWDDRDTPRDEAYLHDVDLARKAHRPAAATYRDIRAAAESGWDFGSRWFAQADDPASIDTTQIVPVDLNSLLYGLEEAIRAGCARARRDACVREFAGRAAARHAAVDRYLWSSARGTYLDYRWTSRASTQRLSAAALYPLFVSLASAEQAGAVATMTRERLLEPGGLVATPLVTGEQWDSPNGWAPLQWIAVAGLRRYGEDALAAEIACRWMHTVNEVYQRTGKLVEKYDVLHTDRKGAGGEYPTQDGFGWTNGVMLELEALYGTRTPGGKSACPTRRTSDRPGVPPGRTPWRQNY